VEINMSPDANIQEARELVTKAKKITAYTGAGISVD
jgi:NAD-dependent SIR2 family protein deacetylase